jgi:hypothetical protein
MGLSAHGHLCVHQCTPMCADLDRKNKPPWQPVMAHPGDTQAPASGPKTTTGGGYISASTLPPSLHLPAPSCFDGRKNFQLFPSLFFQTGDSLGKGIPPPQTINLCINAIDRGPSCYSGTVTVIFGCFMGVASQGRGCGGAQLPSSSRHPPSQVPPHPHPILWPSSGRGEGSLLSQGINNSGGYSALRTRLT